MASYVGHIAAGGATNLVVSTLYGTCAVAAGTAVKQVDIAQCDALLAGMTVHVKFAYSNTADSPSLKINSTDAWPIYTEGTTFPGKTPTTSWRDNSVVSFTFDGTAWRMNDAGLSTAAGRSDLIDLFYPVGSIYMTESASFNPNTQFGGTWVRIQDRFLMAAGQTYPATTPEGGSATATLQTENLPAHTHEVGAHTHAIGEHTHEVAAHSHSLSSHTHTVGNHTHGLSGHTHGWPGGVGSLHGDNGLEGITRTRVLVGTNGRYAFLGKNGATSADASNLAYVGGTGGPNPNSTDAGGAQTSSGPSTNSTDTLAAFQTANPASGDTGENEAFASGSTGSGTAFGIIPPYRAVYVWRRDQ